MTHGFFVLNYDRRHDIESRGWISLSKYQSVILLQYLNLGRRTGSGCYEWERHFSQERREFDLGMIVALCDYSTFVYLLLLQFVEMSPVHFIVLAICGGTSSLIYCSCNF
jgi:hypothetical protein